MQALVLNSYAKVNLTLDVLDKRPEDGYHYIRTIMLPVQLADQVTLRPAPEMSLACEPDVVGPVEGNLAMKAARLLQDVTGYAGGAAIHIQKQIPVAGGLAGGSTNGAAVLAGLNRLWGTGLTTDHLLQLAIRLGSDVPFFVNPAPALVEGIGERVTSIAVSQPLWLVLATPDVPKSTANVYRLFDELPQVFRPDTDAMRAALAAGDVRRVAAALGNVFEQVMLPRHAQIAALKHEMVRSGALGAVMSGAGPTVLGVVSDEEMGRYVARQVQELAPRVYLTRTLASPE